MSHRTDPTQMPRWSPENTGALTPAEARPLTEGEVFDGTNRRGRARWTTECVVTAAEPGRRFAFDGRKTGPRTPFIPGSVATWAAAIFDKAATGGRLFADYQRGNIKRTLARMKAEFEDASRPS